MSIKYKIMKTRMYAWSTTSPKIMSVLLIRRISYLFDWLAKTISKLWSHSWMGHLFPALLNSGHGQKMFVNSFWLNFINSWPPSPKYAINSKATLSYIFHGRISRQVMGKIRTWYKGSTPLSSNGRDKSRKLCPTLIVSKRMKIVGHWMRSTIGGNVVKILSISMSNWKMLSWRKLWAS